MIMESLNIFGELFQALQLKNLPLQDKRSQMFHCALRPELTSLTILVAVPFSSYTAEAILAGASFQTSAAL